MNYLFIWNILIYLNFSFFFLPKQKKKPPSNSICTLVQYFLIILDWWIIIIIIVRRKVHNFHLYFRMSKINQVNKILSQVVVWLVWLEDYSVPLHYSIKISSLNHKLMHSKAHYYLVVFFQEPLIKLLIFLVVVREEDV